MKDNTIQKKNKRHTLLKAFLKYEHLVFSKFTLLLILNGLIWAVFIFFDKPYQLIKADQGVIYRFNRITGESKMFRVGQDIPSVEEEQREQQLKNEATKWHILKNKILIKYNLANSQVRVSVFIPKKVFEKARKKSSVFTLSFQDHDSYKLFGNRNPFIVNANDFTLLNAKDSFFSTDTYAYAGTIDYIEFEEYLQIANAQLSDGFNRFNIDLDSVFLKHKKRLLERLNSEKTSS